VSPPASNDAPIGGAPKPKPNIYTVLLALSLVLVLLAILLLWLEMGVYEYKKDAALGSTTNRANATLVACDSMPRTATGHNPVAAIS